MRPLIVQNALVREKKIYRISPGEITRGRARAVKRDDVGDDDGDGSGDDENDVSSGFEGFPVAARRVAPLSHAR